jgi:hypothetical protein
MFPGNKKWFRQISWLLIPVLALTFSIAKAQQLTATLSGIAADQTDARIPGANIKVTSDTSGDVRETKADSSGFFAVTALIPGTYTLSVSSKGFATWKENGILLNQGDSRTVPNIHLKISSDATAVTVVSGADAEVPTDTAEVSATLNNELVDSATLTGRNAAEMIKMMPGITFNNAGGVGGYTSTTTGTNSGPAGSFSANGTQPYGSTDVYLDGANLIDPGNAGTQVANINQDMTDSVKYLSASYGAEYAKGPAVLQAFSKSGGQKFHGEAYVYVRNGAAAYANDWYNKNQQINNAKALGATQSVADAANQVYPQNFEYIGGNIGGPIFFKGFNKNKDKLFFWGGYEKMIQHPYNSPVEMNVPTAAQLAGDFNLDGSNPLGINDTVPAGVYNPQNNSGEYTATYAMPCNTDDGWQGCGAANSPWGGYGSGDIKPFGTGAGTSGTAFNAGGAAITGLNPKANQTAAVGNGWNNYNYSPSTPQNRWEGTGKVTYAFNENNKLWGSYTYQSEKDLHPLSIWWAPEWTIPYPGSPAGVETAKVYLANFTHVFSATTTNEFVFAYANFENDDSLGNATPSSRAAVGFPTGSLFGSSLNGSSSQIPNFTGGWASGLTEINEFSFAGGIYGKNSFGKTSKAPSISDTFTKIIKTHSIKAGFYWDAQENLQSAGLNVNGGFDVETWGATSTYNDTLDRLMGRNYSYNEQSTDPVPDELWHQWSVWAQDSWKATRKLTVNIGLRADHMGQWYDKLGGSQVWDLASYNNTTSAPANTGLLWAGQTGLTKSIPKSGWKSQLFLYDPRVGFAYDVFGNGKTVVRGGGGTYRYQVSNNDAGASMTGPLGSFNFNTSTDGTNGFYGYNITSGLLNTNAAGTTTHQEKIPALLNQNGSSPKADAEGDDHVPYADTYSFGVAQALPSHTVAEFSYVGSVSKNQLLNGANGHIQDQNPVPYGAFFSPDPVTGVLMNPGPIVSGTAAVTAHDYQKLHNYSNIYLLTHGGHANYNSLQVSAQKQSGNLFVFTNFTFGKVLGTRDGSTSNGNGNGTVVNPFNLNSNYGQLGYDHTKAFNLSFSYKLPKPIHNNWILGEAINGWQLSGYTTYQDGSPYQANTPNMNATYNQLKNAAGVIQQTFTMPDGQQTQSIGYSEWVGSNEYENGLQPVLVCDPRKNTAKGQYFNPGCFVAPLPPTASSYGQNGQFVWPYVRTPHYIGSDMAIFKSFRVTDSQHVEARISATNWLNHPNAGFGIAGTSDNQLIFNGVSEGSTLAYNTNTSTTGTPQSKYGFRWLQFAAKYYF